MTNATIPAGYKQTEVGIIPEDWEVNSLNKIIKQISAGVSVNSVETDDYDDSVVSVLKTSAVYEGRFIPSESKKITTNDIKRAKVNPCADSIIVSRMNTPLLVGECGYVDRDHPNIFVPDRLWMIEFADTKTNAKWLSSLLSYSKFRSAIKEIATGTSGSMKNIAKSEFLALLVIFPSIKEQTAIATVLSDVDALIASLNAQIAKKRDIKTATMQQLLTGKQRLAGFGEGKGMKPSELGEIPEDWEVVQLGEVGQSLIGLTYNPNQVVEFGTLVLRSSNVQQGKLAFDNNVYVNMILPERVIVEEGDILICVRNGSKQLIGKCALIDKETAGSAFGAFMSIYRSKHNGFIFHQFQSNIIQNQINEVMGATINQITNKDMASFKIPFPDSNEEQEAIAGVLSAMDEDIAALEQRLAKTKALKQGMMQELLTGRTRLV